ncbi:hypothetical protein GMLC_09310 [Geomonas limicola]|uniref:Lipoprotein n=1 Tax=Geomonas limicola TaxID=2740186 RepID=A0A6V8N492_9BACT|nr:hypothetical protein [Geomonas limicola]GFO67352.1 hypothetical protein GMLC_09310 [Geomonas limicola]
MRNIKRMLLRTLAIAAFSGLTMGGSTALATMDTGAGGHGHPGVTDDSRGSGGGSINPGSDSNNDNPSSPSSDYYQGNTAQPDYYQGSTDQSGSGSATGGSVEDQVITHDRGTTVNGTFWPDYSHEVGPGGAGYWSK